MQYVDTYYRINSFYIPVDGIKSTQYQFIQFSRAFSNQRSQDMNEGSRISFSVVMFWICEYETKFFMTENYGLLHMVDYILPNYQVPGSNKVKTITLDICISMVSVNAFICEKQLKVLALICIVCHKIHLLAFDSMNCKRNERFEFTIVTGNPQIPWINHN